MNAFEYQRPASVADAARAIAAATDGKLLGGGQSLLGAMKMGLAAPAALVDLSAVAELKGVCIDGNNLVIGGGTTHTTVAESADVRKAIPALAALAGNIGDRAVRTLGTIGGSLANNDPAACYPSAVLALGATIKTDKRTIAADDFFKGLYETALGADEIIVSVSFPIPQKAAYVKFKQPASRFALVGVFVAKFAAGVRVAVTGSASHVFRVAALESALSANWSAAAAKAVTVPADGLSSDLHASAEYRAHLIPVLAARAVTQAG